MQIVKMNKGEWGEPYAAIKILGEGKIYSADENENRVLSEWMDVLKLIRYETRTRIVEYGYDEEQTNVTITINGRESSSVLVSEFIQKAQQLQNEIITGTGNSFSVSNEMMEFFALIEMLHLKASSIEKSDLFLTLYDVKTGAVRQKVGFSVKSAFGENPTLFNTGAGSRAVYEIKEGMNDTLMNKINNMTDSLGHAAVSKRCETLLQEGCKLNFQSFGYAPRAGCCPLQITLDTLNPRLITVIERILWRHFFQGETLTDVSPLIDKIVYLNPCNAFQPSVAYPNMFKDFLFNAYGGLTASKVWDGTVNANGGLIHVKRDGDIVVHYVRDISNFREFLYRNCYFEWPSTGKGHGDYAYVYKENGKYYYNLNFQIRYKT